MSDTDRTRELSRLLSTHRSALFSDKHWEKLLASPSKMRVDHVLWVFNSDVGDISPRAYFTHSDTEVRDAICEWLGRPYAELPDSSPMKRDLMWTFAVWWWGVVGVIFVLGCLVALVRAILGL